MERMNLELGKFDVDLILKTLNDAYNQSIKEVRVDAKWVQVSENGEPSHNEFIPSHTEFIETKESKRLKSTINYIKKQL